MAVQEELRGMRRGSITDILKAKWTVTTSALSLSLVATDPSGLVPIWSGERGMVLSAERLVAAP